MDKELLLKAFEGTNVLEKLWTDSSLPLNEWHGIFCDEDSESITKIILAEEGLTKQIDFTKLPPSLKELYLMSNELNGSVDLTNLPKHLEQLMLFENQFNGSVDLTKLPETLTHLYLFDNKFSGSIDLNKLPSKLESLFLQNNLFSGAVDLSNVPSTLQDLLLHDNHFSKITGTETLPKGISFTYHQKHDATESPTVFIGGKPVTAETLSAFNQRVAQKQNVNSTFNGNHDMIVMGMFGVIAIPLIHSVMDSYPLSIPMFVTVCTVIATFLYVRFRNQRGSEMQHKSQTEETQTVDDDINDEGVEPEIEGDDRLSSSVTLMGQTHQSTSDSNSVTLMGQTHESTLSSRYLPEKVMSV